MAIQEVIKYEGDNDILIYKHPAEDFNTLSQLIVHESQEAVFFSAGKIGFQIETDYSELKKVIKIEEDDITVE